MRRKNIAVVGMLLVTCLSSVGCGQKKDKQESLAATKTSAFETASEKQTEEKTEIARCCQGLLKHLLLTKQILACLRSCFFFCFHVYSKFRPSFSIYNCIAQNFTPYRTSIHKNILYCNANLRIRHLFHHKLINRFTCIIIIMKSVHCGKYTAV